MKPWERYAAPVQPKPWERFSAEQKTPEVNKLQQRLNVRRGLNPDGTPLQPGAGHGVRGVKDVIPQQPEPDYVPAPLKKFADVVGEAQNYTDTLVGAGIEGTGKGIQGIGDVGAIAQERERRAAIRQKEVNAYIKDAMEWGLSREEAEKQALRDVPVDRSPIDLKQYPIASALTEEGGERQAETDADFRAELNRSGLEGDITSPSTWGVKEGTTLRGMAGQAARIAGAMTPIAASAFVPGIGPALAVGGAGGQGARGAYDEQSQRILGMDEAELQQIPRYQELLRSMSPQEARESLAKTAGQEAAIPAGAIAGASGLIPGGRLTAATRAASTRALGSNVVGRGVGELPQLALEGGSEILETGAAIGATNTATGENRSALEGSFETGLLGAAGAGPGIIAGALSPSAVDYQRQADTLKAERAVADTPEQEGTLDVGIALAEARGRQAEKKTYYANRQPAAEPVAQQDRIDQAELSRMLAEQFPDNPETEIPVTEQDQQVTDAGLQISDQAIQDNAPVVEQDVSQPAILASRNVEPPNDTGIESEELDPNDPAIQRMLAEQEAGMQRRELERKEGPSDALTEGFRALAENPSLFRTGMLKSGKDLTDIAPKVGVKYGGVGFDQDSQLPYHKIIVDQKQAGPAEAKVFTVGNAVWIDVAGLEKGGGAGERVYNAAQSLAVNNGKEFIQDPAGLSDTAMYRRAVQQVSGILKAGGAENFPVGEFLSSQRVGGPATRPIKQDPQRRINPSLREHLLTVASNATLAVPEVKGIRYDADSNQFVDRSGAVVTDADFDRLADYRRANPVGSAMVRSKRGDADTKVAAPVGGNSLKVAALVDTLARTTDPATQSKLVGSLRALAASSDGLGVLEGILPSRVNDNANQLRQSGAVSEGSSNQSVDGGRGANLSDDRWAGGVSPGTRGSSEQVSPEATERADRTYYANRKPGVSNGRLGQSEAPKNAASASDASPVSARGEGGARGSGVVARSDIPRRSGSNIRDVREHLLSAFGTRARKLIDNGQSKIVQSERDVPAEIRSRSEPLSQADGTIQGFYDPKTQQSYIIADNVKSLDDARAVFLHEEGVHAGLKAILGDRFDAIADRLEQIEKSGNEADKALIARARRRVESAETPSQFVREELIAHTVELAERTESLSSRMKQWLESVYAAIRLWAASKGIGNTRLSVNDIRLIARAALGKRARSEGSVKASRTAENESYVGEHSAPMSDSGAPANDVTGGGNFYPDDVYSANGPRYYGDGSRLDAEAFSIVNRLRGRPNAAVKIYRAVPSVKTNSEKLADVDAEMAKILRRGGESGRYDWLYAERERLRGMQDDPIKPMKINKGDWVSITRAYAIDHGRSALNGNFKIVSKTVYARDIFTNGDSIQEWGYDPQPPVKMKRSEAADGINPSGTTPDQTKTKAFRDWFGASKVVDEKGKPLVVYHGTHSEFTEFKPNDAIGGGIFFSPDPKEAGAFASARGANIMPVYLSAKRVWPRVVRSYDEVKAIEKAKASGYDAVRVRDATDGVINWVVFKPEQIKSAIGNSGAFDPSNPSILASRVVEPDNITESRRTAADKRAQARDSLGVNGEPLTWAYDSKRFDGIKGYMRHLREQMQDKYLSILDAQGDIEAAKGAALEDSENVYRRENLMHHRASGRIAALSDNHTEPLKKAMKRAGVSVAQLEDYLEARAAKARNEDVAKRNPDMPDGGSGMSTQDAQDFLDGKADGYRSKSALTAEQRRKVEVIAKQVDAIRDETLLRLRDSGQITKEAYAALSQNRTYAPLRGKDGEELGGVGTGGGIDVRGKPFKMALGRGEGNRASNILAEIIGDAERSIVQAEKTRVGQTLLRLVLKNPNKDIWEVEPVKIERKFSESQQAVYEAMANIDRDPGSVRVMVEGKPYRIVLKDARMAAAVKNLGAEQMNAFFKFMGAINRYFSAVLTRYNPAFVPINMIRDLGMGIIGISAEHGLKAGKDAMVSYLPAMRALWREARGKPVNTQTGQYAREFSEAGGRTGFQTYDNVAEIAEQIGDDFKSAWQMIREFKPRRLVARTLKESALVKVIEDANDAIENTMRLSAYIAQRKKGMSVEKAAEYAKNVTVNFNRRGQVTSQINALYLFFNAAVQGSTRTFQLLKNPKVMATMGGLATLQFVLASMAMGADDEDEDGLTAWEKIPDYEKERNLIFPIVGEKDGKMTVKMVKIPMPYGFNFFPYLGGRLAQAMNSKDDADVTKLTNDMGVAAVGAVSPLKFTDGMQGVKPYLLKVFDSLGYNKNDFGDQITSERPYSDYPYPRASMGRASTPKPYQDVATALNRLGGGDEVTPPKIMANLLDRSPEDLRFLTEAFGGGLLRTGTQIYSAGEKKYAGLDLNFNDVPVLKSLFSEVDMERSTENRYREVTERVAREKDRLRKVYDNEGKEAALKLIAETPELSGVQLHRFQTGKFENKNGDIQLDAKRGTLAEGYKAAEKKIDELRRRIRMVRIDSSLTVAERRKQMESLEAEKAKAQNELNTKWSKVQ